MPSALMISAFQEQLNTAFEVMNISCSLTLEQVAIHAQTEKHEAFSLFFDGPAVPFLQQRTYVLQHAVLGELEIFLVPVGRTPGGFQYEAVFNHVF